MSDYPTRTGQDRAEEAAYVAQPWAHLPRPVLSDRWMDDGNAFALLGHASRAQREAGWPQEARTAWHTEATSGDYDHLLRTILATCDSSSTDDWEG
jgi:hypothetical protein